MRFGGGELPRTSATGAESTVSVAAFGANSDDLAVDVLGVIGVDVAGAATTMRDFRSSHGEYEIKSRSWLSEMGSAVLKRRVVAGRGRGSRSASFL